MHGALHQPTSTTRLEESNAVVLSCISSQNLQNGYNDEVIAFYALVGKVDSWM